MDAFVGGGMADREQVAAAGKKLVLIDGYSIINRAFYGVPPLSDGQGRPTNGLYGFLNILFKILEEEQPQYLVVALDAHAPTFRHGIFQDYKGTRKSMPPELREQLPRFRGLLAAMGILAIEQAGYEADDILGSLALRAAGQGMEVCLVSGDRDLLQVATDMIRVRIPKTKGGRTVVENYDRAAVLEAYGCAGAGFVDFKALMGDASDNIPGVPKIGEKTARSLIEQYGSLEGIYSHLEEIGKKSVRESLAENKDLAFLSRELARICTAMPLEPDWESAKAEGYFNPESYRWMQELGFKQYLKKFSGNNIDLNKITDNNSAHSWPLPRSKSAAGQEPVPGRESADSGVQEKNAPMHGGEEGAYQSVSQEELASALEMQLALSGGDPCPMAFWIWGQPGAFGGMALDVPGHGLLWADGCGGAIGGALARALESWGRAGGLLGFGLKQLYSFFPGKMESHGDVDVQLAAYLLDPLHSDPDMAQIAQTWLGLALPPREESGEGDSALACAYARAIAEAVPRLEEALRTQGMEGLFAQIEMPLGLVLYHMEREGICVQKPQLLAFSDELGEGIRRLEAEIWDLAGEEFNIHSPKQLGEILFGRMGLKGGKKTKTGYSTAADVLEKLALRHPIAQKVLEFRTLAKLKSTYADGLAAYIEEDGRIHTRFHQCVTATGRLSSSDPNLQNIPTRLELGRKLRKVFVPRPGWRFADADYSQIELRILAHMSQDAKLLEAYRQGRDIHAITAATVFGVPLEEVSDRMRRHAKAVNFGIIYGISSFGLGRDLDIMPGEAAKYMEQYFASYPQIKEFLDYLVNSAKSKGYAESLYGRRRPMPELASSNHVQRAFGERVAMNAPIQGSAADIMKIAMIGVFAALRKQGLQSKLLLQIHDELLVEVAPGEEEAVERILREQMQGAAALSVDLEVDFSMGDSWYGAK